MVKKVMRKKATKKSMKTVTGQCEKKKIYIGNISMTTSIIDLMQQLLLASGNIPAVTIRVDDFYRVTVHAFYDSHAAALAAVKKIHKLNLDGRILVCYRAWQSSC